MKKIQLLAILLVVGIFLFSCSDSSNDNGGTTGGSGEVNSAAATDGSANQEQSSNDESTSAASGDTAAVEQAPVSSSEIWLDAFSDWNCGGNWTERDGALGLVVYSGNDSCSTSFPGESGTYQLVLDAQTEFDGQSQYRVSINGQMVAEGYYPWSSSLKCDCPIDDWRSVCPDQDTDIGLGTYNLNYGDVIEFWGADDYPCGAHGSYAKWHGITAYRQ